METFYACKNCNELLTIEDSVVLDVVTSSGETVNCYFSTEIGNYQFRTDPPTQFNESELVEYHCPHCHIDLTSTKHPKFAEVDLLVNEDIKFDVLFSRDINFKKTYVITEDYVEEYGDNSQDLDDIFDVKTTE